MNHRIVSHLFRTIWGIFFVCLFLLIGVAYGWSSHFAGLIPPNVWIGSISVGGMDPEATKETVQTKIDDILQQGIPVVLMGKTAVLPLTTSTSSNATDDVWFDVDLAIQKAMEPERANKPFLNMFHVVRSLFRGKMIPMTVQINRAQITESAEQLFPEAELPILETSFVFQKNADEWKGTVREGTPGYEYQWDAFFADLASRLARIEASPITMTLANRAPAVSTGEALAALPKVIALISRTPFTLFFPSVESPEKTYEMTDEEIAKIIAPQKANGGSLSVNKKAFEKFAKKIGPLFEQPAIEGRFRMESGRVAEFVQSANGRLIDREAFEKNLLKLFQSETEISTAIPMMAIAPKQTLEQVNMLGIKEMLGVGTSSFKGSPSNRVKNIKNGARLLNGILIAPGETFSLLNALKPFTPENGYLPELVIKGDRIKPELGGGLCQIGTTTFRAALNSGLPIIERSNHSLVVSYYNDPSNHNPGTDATIYEPAPDFKFLNDTENTILFQTEVLSEKAELHFTFWGTSDGRKGSYTPPIVSKWIPIGEPKTIETLDLPPGEKKCQEAHVGAEASFTYSLLHPDGTTTNRVFTSHYRPLPEICLLGVEKISETDPATPETPAVKTPTPLTP